MSTLPFGLLEFGSNSLKFYRVQLGPGGHYQVETRKFPWRVAHEYFQSGGLNDSIIGEILGTLQEVQRVNAERPTSSMLSVATGVFREFRSIDVLAARVKSDAGLRLRVISGRDEAKLMARSFHYQGAEPLLLCDIGGATSEWAWIVEGKRKACGSLRLGAIRNSYILRDTDPISESYLEKSQEICDAYLADLPVTLKSDVVATGGTAKALVTIVGKEEVSVAELEETIHAVRTSGPPKGLEPQRAEVLLAGLIILERFMMRCQAEVVHYGQASVRDGMAARLVHLLRTREPRDLHSTLLLKKDSSAGHKLL